MVEQNNNDNTKNDEAPKRRSRLFGGRRARSADLEARGGVEQSAPVEQAAGSQAVAAPAAEAPGADASVEVGTETVAVTDDAAPEVSVAVETTAGADEPHDVSTLTGDLPVVAADDATTETAAAPAADVTAPADDVTAPADASSASGPAEPADEPYVPRATSTTSLIFHAPVLPDLPPRAPRSAPEDDDEQGGGRRRSRRRGGSAFGGAAEQAEPRRREREREPELITEPQRIKGSTRLEAKKQRRRDGRDAGRRRQVITEDEFLARRESVDRQMIVRSSSQKIEIGVLEDGVLAEHYVTKSHNVSLIGNVYLGKVQNVLPSMEAAFVDIGRGRNAVLYAGEVDWNSVDTSHGRRIESALKPGDKVLVQVTKDPVGHKGARLTSQVSLPGRYLVYVPNGSMNGISRKLPDTERARLKKILKEVLPEHAGVIVRTAAEGATEEQLTRDVQRLTSQWEAIQKKVAGGHAPVMLHSEPDLLVKIVRDVFNEDFTKLIIDGDAARGTIEDYLDAVAPDLKDRVEIYDGPDSFEEYRLNEQIEKALDRKVWLPSGGSLVIDRTEAMTVVDVNTGKFVGSGGNLEETVTKNNLEAAEEIVRQLRLRDIGGIIVVDFIDMVLESNRDLVLRRLVECLSRDRTKHQVAEVTSLGLVQMTRKKIGVGLRESLEEVNAKVNDNNADPGPSKGRRKGRGGNGSAPNGNGGNSGSNGNGGAVSAGHGSQTHQITDDVKNALSRIAASTLPHEERAAAEAAAVSGVAVTGVASPTTPESAPEAPAPATSSTSSSEAPAESSGGPKRRRRRGSRSGGEPQATEASASAEASGIASAGEQSSSVTDAPADPVDAAPVAEPQTATAEPVPTTTPPARRRVSSSAPVTPTENTVAILDIPVAVTKREPRAVPAADAESLLDSVLNALPEPKQPGQGRSRSRRVSSPSISAPASTEGDTPEDGTVIVGN
ncbi:Rne/Rng family ribonuclease [Curtobacterium sp. 1P10AnD]|uniref:Rne/Rng family ribonuclease n=1 Tax=Curtobacterium sp. 1P10AnD TaxID=3132283 RepID=UPI0039A0862F